MKWVFKVKVISWPWHEVIYKWKLKLRSPTWPFLTKFLCKLLGTWKWKLINMTKMAARLVWYKNPFKNLFLPVERIRWNFGMYDQGLQPIIVCSNNDPGLTLTHFWARLNFAAYPFIFKNVTVMDSLEIHTACDLDIGWYTWPWIKVYEVPLIFAEHLIDIQGPDIRWAFTRPLVLWFSFSFYTSLFSWL